MSPSRRETLGLTLASAGGLAFSARAESGACKSLTPPPSRPGIEGQLIRGRGYNHNVADGFLSLRPASTPPTKAT